MVEKRVYFFGAGRADGGADRKDLLGGKGANLAEMTNLGIPVPPGFTLTTECCAAFAESGRWPQGLEDEVREAMARLEKLRGQRFGDPDNPLLVSVRSGAAVSMPGMMDTVLNLGLTAAAVEGLARRTGNPRFAWDSYRRFVNMFGDVVCGVAHEAFEEAMSAVKRERGAKLDTELDAGALEELCRRYLEIFERATGEAFPDDPWEQLRRAIDAVFGSWNNERAVTYRRLHGIHGLKGTAVNVQSMVFGNFGENSGTGVGFTRDPSTGENVFYGEFLENAQGEDVVAGIRTPRPIAEIDEVIPGTYEKLLDIKRLLEGHYRDMQDIEFTIQEGELFLLQTRTGKRTGKAAVKIAVDMAREGLIDEDEALLQVDASALDQLLHPDFDPDAEKKEIGRGLGASPGAASGRVRFFSDEAEEAGTRGEAVILVRHETSPEDIGGMHAAAGILTSTGGKTSHAAVVARGMGKCCIVGAEEVEIDYEKRVLRSRGVEVPEGEWISLDGTTGAVYLGRVPTVDPTPPPEFEVLMGWADERRRMRVRANADTPQDCEVARRLGAEGIGLCRTEHMFFDEERILAVREMILAGDEEARRRAIAKLLPFQRRDFVGILRAMDGLPVTVRLLDPPLHEFLPFDRQIQREVAQALGLSEEDVRRKVAELKEQNPMLGHRGCRLGLTYPEIYEMQVRSVVEAAAECASEGVDVHVEIMHPLVAIEAEIEELRRLTERVVAEVRAESGFSGEILIGTMIEVPRAALTADRIARHADFFSFGTNDLTQMTFGLSRDDTGPLLLHYQSREWLPDDPFSTLDVDGVGGLVRTACERGRATRADLKLGICGEHGGDPRSIDFCEEVGLDYVSCSPYRVPIARLAAAQATLRRRR